MLSTAGKWTVIAGNGAASRYDAEGPRASFNSPGALALASGVLYVADTQNNAIRMINLSGASAGGFQFVLIGCRQ